MVRRCEVQASTRAGRAAGPAAESRARAAELDSTTSWMSNRSAAGSATRLLPAASVTGLHAVNRIGRAVSRSANVPVTWVGTSLPLTWTSGPSPHGSRSAPCGANSGTTPGMDTSEICTGICAGVNRSVTTLVRSGRNRSTPPGPTWPPRTCRPPPVTSTWSSPDAPGGRWMVSWLTQRGWGHRMRSHGCGLSGPDTQVVAGLPSKADRAWSSGSAVYAEEARTQVVPPYRMYRRTSLVDSATTVPVSWAWPPAASVKDWSKPYCSSVSVLSAGEHTQRCGVCMHPLGCGSVLVSSTTLGSPLPPGTVTGGATITRLASRPGTWISEMPTWVPSTGCGRNASRVTVIRSQPDAPAGTRSDWVWPLGRTRSDIRPAAVLTSTPVTGGPMAALSANVTRITRARDGCWKPIWIHCPTGPVQLPDSHIVRRFPSMAEYGIAP